MLLLIGTSLQLAGMSWLHSRWRDCIAACKVFERYHAENHHEPLYFLRGLYLLLLVLCHHLSMPSAPSHLVEGGDLRTSTSHLEILSVHLGSQHHTQVIHACVVCECTQMCSSERKKNCHK